VLCLAEVSVKAADLRGMSATYAVTAGRPRGRVVRRSEPPRVGPRGVNFFFFFRAPLAGDQPHLHIPLSTDSHEVETQMSSIPRSDRHHLKYATKDGFAMRRSGVRSSSSPPTNTRAWLGARLFSLVHHRFPERPRATDQFRWRCGVEHAPGCLSRRRCCPALRAGRSCRAWSRWHARQRLVSPALGPIPARPRSGSVLRHRLAWGTRCGRANCATDPLAHLRGRSIVGQGGP